MMGVQAMLQLAMARVHVSEHVRERVCECVGVHFMPFVYMENRGLLRYIFIPPAYSLHC